LNQQQPKNPAETYEDYFVPAMFLPWATILLRHAALQAGERVLDVACGTGIVARQAAPLVGADGQVVALAKDMREANGRGEKLGLSEDELAFSDALEAVGSSSGTLLGGVPLLVGLGIGILSWGAEGFVLLFTLRAMGQQASGGLSLLPTSVSALAGAMSALPGGLGAAELSMVAILVAAGVRPGEAGTASLISRLSTLWLGVKVGVVATMSTARQIAQAEWSGGRQ